MAICSLAMCSQVRPTKVLMSGECEDSLPLVKPWRTLSLSVKQETKLPFNPILESREDENGAQELLSLYLVVTPEQELVVKFVADSCPCPHISAVTHPYHCAQPTTFP